MSLWVVDFIVFVSFIHRKNYVLLSHIYNFSKKAVNGCGV